MTRAAARSLAALGLAITLAGAAFGNPTPSGRSAPPARTGESARSVEPDRRMNLGFDAVAFDTSAMAARTTRIRASLLLPKASD